MAHTAHIYRRDIKEILCGEPENINALLCKCTLVLFMYFKVPLGVQLKNENIIEEMVDIMSETQKYVPTLSKILDIECLEEQQ